MKKVYLLFLSAMIVTGLFAQNCVTTLSGTDFGLDATYGTIIALKVAPDSAKWFCLKNDFGGGYGIGKFDGTDWTAFKSTNSDLPDDQAFDVAFDESGYVWVATKSGLTVFDGNSTTGWEIFNTSNSDIPEDNVTAVAVDSGNVKWVGFNSGKVARFDGSTWTVYHEWVNGPVKTINVDSSHNIWFGMNQSPGMARYDHTSWTLYPGYSYIHSIQFKDSHVYASDFNGIHVYDGMTWTDIPAPPAWSLYHIAIDKDGKVWLSSNNGIIELRDETFITYDPNNSGVPPLLSHPCAFDQENKLWFSYQYVQTFTYCATGYLEENDGLGVEILSDKDFVFCDGDSTVLDAGDGFASYKWSTGETGNTVVTYISDTIDVTVSDGSGCFDYDTVITFKHEVYGGEEICVVTVVGGENLVVWNRTENKGTASYNIYKETAAAGVYDIIGTVPYGDLSVFPDLNSQPETRSERYKIAAVDTCGNVSEMSAAQKTMHLTLNVGVGGVTNLIWDHYEGIDFSSYIIFRGTNADNLVEFDVIPNNIFTYTDNEFGEWFYRVGVVMPEVCNPLLFLKAGAGPYSHSYSNLEDNRLQINLPPSDISISDTLVPEQEPAGTFIGKLSTYDADSAGVFVYTLVTGEGDTDNSNFTISNDSLYTAVVLNFDEKAIHHIRIRSTDSELDSLWVEEPFQIAVVAMDNSAPIDIIISADNISENMAAGSLVGIFSTTDLNMFDSHTYTLVAGEGDDNNSSFNVIQDSLVSAEMFDYETKTSYSIRVRSTDDGEGNLYFEKAFVILINDELDTDVEDIYTDRIQIYPNPWSDIVTVKFINPEAHSNTCIITDLSGKVIRMIEDIQTDSFTFSRGNMKSGYYIIRLVGENIYTDRFMIR